MFLFLQCSAEKLGFLGRCHLNIDVVVLLLQWDLTLTQAARPAPSQRLPLMNSETLH